jgi:hypothetical protein
VKGETMDINERKEAIELALSVLKMSLIDTKTSMAIYDNKLIFFGTQDYIETGSVNKVPRFSVSIEDLVRYK